MSQITGILDPERESSALNIIRNKRLTFMQQILELYKIGEDTVGPVTVNEELAKAKEEGYSFYLGDIHSCILHRLCFELLRDLR